MSDDDNIIEFPGKDDKKEETMDDILESLESDEDFEDIPEEDETGDSIVSLLNELLKEAIDKDVDYIHFESTRDNLICRYETDRALSSVKAIPKLLHRGIIARLKIIAELDIVERRLPQIGKISLRLDDGGPFQTFLVSTLPGLFGENVTLERIRDLSEAPFELSSEAEATILDYLKGKPGMVFLGARRFSDYCKAYYGFMKRIADKGKRIINIDPNVPRETVENIENVSHILNINIGVQQLQRSIRAAIHTAPHILMLNYAGMDEMTTAIDRYFSGNDIGFILSVPFGSCLETIDNLRSNDVDILKLINSRPLFVNFRMYKKNCPDCCRDAVLSREDKMWLKERKIKVSGEGVMRAEGCPACMGTGVSGHVIQEEVLLITDSLIHEIKDRAGEPVEALLKEHITRNPDYQSIMDDISKGLICYDDISVLKESM